MMILPAALSPCPYICISVFLKNIWRIHRPIWKPGCQSATSSKSTRLERSSPWTDWVWTSTRIRSPLSSATTGPEKQPQCKSHYVFLSCFATRLSDYVISASATNLTSTDCRLTAAALIPRSVFSKCDIFWEGIYHTESALVLIAGEVLKK